MGSCSCALRRSQLAAGCSEPGAVEKSEDDFVKAFKEVHPRKINTSYLVPENRCTVNPSSVSSQTSVLHSSVPQKQSTVLVGPGVPQKRSTDSHAHGPEGSHMVPPKLWTGNKGIDEDRTSHGKRCRSAESVYVVSNSQHRIETSSNSSTSSSTSSSSESLSPPPRSRCGTSDPPAPSANSEHVNKRLCIRRSPCTASNLPRGSSPSSQVCGGSLAASSASLRDDWERDLQKPLIALARANHGRGSRVAHATAPSTASRESARGVQRWRTGASSKRCGA